MFPFVNGQYSLSVVTSFLVVNDWRNVAHINDCKLPSYKCLRLANS